MQIFSDSGFETGKWAGELAKLLRQAKILDELVPKARVWRATWNQWIQFEPDWHVGPAFWFGKPALLSEDGFLQVGYYVERGLLYHPTHPEYVITPEWHWHGFIRCLEQDHCRQKLNILMQELPEERRYLWIHILSEEKGTLLNKSLAYEGAKTLDDFGNLYSEAPEDHWVEVMLGVRFSKNECLSLQKKIVSDLRTPLIRADEIRWLALQQLKK